MSKRILITGRAASKKTTLASVLVRLTSVRFHFDMDWVIEMIRPTYKNKAWHGDQLSINPAYLANQCYRFCGFLKDNFKDIVISYNTPDPYAFILAMQGFVPTHLIHLTYDQTRFRERWCYDMKDGFVEGRFGRVYDELSKPINAAIANSLTRFISQFKVKGMKQEIIDVTDILRIEDIEALAVRLGDFLEH